MSKEHRERYADRYGAATVIESAVPPDLDLRLTPEEEAQLLPEGRDRVVPEADQVLEVHRADAPDVRLRQEVVPLTSRLLLQIEEVQKRLQYQGGLVLATERHEVMQAASFGRLAWKYLKYRLRTRFRRPT